MIIGRTKTGQSERGRGLKIIVDFSRDPEWHEIFFGEPTVQKLEEFRSFIIGEGRDRYSEALRRLYHATRCWKRKSCFRLVWRQLNHWIQDERNHTYKDSHYNFCRQFL
jgi:hypothetical protein